ncbi:hypothetical protein MHYP_G00213540 [Metynnis hypsauchen]
MFIFNYFTSPDTPYWCVLARNIPTSLAKAALISPRCAYLWGHLVGFLLSGCPVADVKGQAPSLHRRGSAKFWPSYPSPPPPNPLEPTLSKLSLCFFINTAVFVFNSPEYQLLVIGVHQQLGAYLLARLRRSTSLIGCLHSYKQAPRSKHNRRHFQHDTDKLQLQRSYQR